MRQPSPTPRHAAPSPAPTDGSAPTTGAIQRLRFGVIQMVGGGRAAAGWLRQQAHAAWRSPAARRWRQRGRGWTRDPVAGGIVLGAGVVLATGLLFGINALLGTPLPSPGTLYLPLVAMLAYHWGWRYALAGALLELACVYYFFMAPVARLKPLSSLMLTQLAVLAFVTGFVLALVQLARSRRRRAEREAGRFAALNRIGNSLTGELRERPLLDEIAATARDLTGAEFAAFTLRPVDEQGQPRVPAEGQLFYLAAVVGVSAEQRELFKRMSLGGEGVLAPIFRHGKPVRVADVLALGAGGFHHDSDPTATDRPPERAASREAARAAAARYAAGSADGTALRYVGVPHGHPLARSFLGAPLLDSEGQVRGGLLLGHSLPDHFSAGDQVLLVGLAAQAAVALENARLYRAARTQARELDATFESISDGIMLVDAHGVVLRENGAALQLRTALARGGDTRAAETVLRDVAARALSGSSAEGLSITVMLGERDARDYVVAGAPLLRAAHASTTHRVGTASSAADPWVASAPPEENDVVVVVWHDVTATQRLLAEQRARAEMEARQQLLRLVIDEMPSGIYLVRGPDARLVLANRAAEQVWGAAWTPGQPMVEFLGTSGTRIYGPDGRELAPEHLATLRVARTGEAVHHHQEVIRQASGSSLPVLLNAVAVAPGALAGDRAAGEAERAALVVLQDVTALKEAEYLKDEFIGVAAHELRTPLAVLKGFAEMLTMQGTRGNGQPLAAWQQEALEAIDQATARLVDLIDDLLDVTRLQGGRLQMHLEPHDVAALARRAVRRLPVADARHTLTVTAPPEPVVAVLDPARIEQVLTNLLTNAVKYSPAGGEVVIDVRADPVAGEAVVAVHDHGIGIPVGQQAMLFGRFARAENARELGIAGTGLGLYLCRELVERHGGRIWFESTEGQGSTFFVALPLEPSTAEGAAAPQHEATEGIAG